MRTINGTPLKANTVKAGLNNDILLGVNAATGLMPLPGGYAEFISKAAKLKTILHTGGSTIITGRQDMLIPDSYRPDMMAATG